MMKGPSLAPRSRFYPQSPPRDAAAALAPKSQQLLTEREQEVLRAIAAGKSHKEIGAEMFISPRTVEEHRRKIGEKLGIHRIALLTRYAVKTGLVEL